MLIQNPAFKGLKPGKSTEDRMITIRCGRCEGCLKSKINDWAFRLEQEGRHALHVHFVTLTYSPASVPLTDSLLPTLKKKDVQNFLKRLRKNQNHGNLKYFAVGEYGANTYRPHYHIILFNCDDENDIYKAWSKNGEALGTCYIADDISNGAIPYTLKYMYKKGLVPAFKSDDRLPEFRLMSQKLGIQYLTPETIKWHLKDPKERMYVHMKNGIPVAMPRYFREKLIKISGRSRKAFIKDDDEADYLTHDYKDYRTLESRIQKIKTDQSKFDRKQNQEKRKKL